MAEIISSIGQLIVYILLNPLWYLSFLLIYFLSALRVKREREAFHTRVYAQMTDYIIPLLPALAAGAILSIVIAGIGVVLPKGFFILLIGFYLLAIVTMQLRWMTPSYVLGGLLLFYGCEPFLDEVEALQPVYEMLTNVPMFVIAGLLALFTIVEGVLIRRNGTKYSSPRLKRSKRGMWIGSHETSRLWVLPVLFFIPEGLIPSGGYWPLIAIGDGGWQPILFPILIGFKQQVKTTLPHISIRTMGMRVTGLGLLFGVLAVGSFYVPLLALILGGLAIISKELMWFLAKGRDDHQPAMYTSQQKGCIVLGILPGSPAEKMGIQIGETIVKVNGQPVHGEESFYSALQLNSAFCKLDVLNHDGEIHFAQGALYDGEHHQLGVLLVREDSELQDSII